jgi:hypothetical protein
MGGINKRPRCFSKEEAQFFERTPKRVLFKLLRDFAIQHVLDTGYVDTWPEDPSKWIALAKERTNTAT